MVVMVVGVAWDHHLRHCHRQNIEVAILLQGMWTEQAYMYMLSLSSSSSSSSSPASASTYPLPLLLPPFVPPPPFTSSHLPFTPSPLPFTLPFPPLLSFLSPLLYSRARSSGSAMKLGKKGKDVESFVGKLVAEGQRKWVGLLSDL